MPRCSTECDNCKKAREEIEANPKGGCATCKHSSVKGPNFPCKECFDEVTDTNYWPRWEKR